MKLSRFRFAWSAGWSIGCLLLIALWMRSFYFRDVIGGVAWSHVLTMESADGRIGLDWYYLSPVDSGPSWGLTSYNRRSSGFRLRMAPRIVLTYWSLLLLFGTLGVVAWLRAISWEARLSRFTLRDLFILTTILALGLGLIVYALR